MRLLFTCSGIGYIAPANMLNGRAKEIHAVRDQKLRESRERRKHSRRASRATEKMTFVRNTRPEAGALPRGSSNAELSEYTEGNGVDVA